MLSTPVTGSNRIIHLAWNLSRIMTAFLIFRPLLYVYLAMPRRMHKRRRSGLQRIYTLIKGHKVRQFFKIWLAMGNRMAGRGATHGSYVRRSPCTNGFCSLILGPALGCFFFFFLYPRSSERVKDGGDMGHERRSWAAIVASLGSSMLAIKHQ